MGGCQAQANDLPAGFNFNFKFGNGTGRKKIVTVVIIFNVIVIGAYLVCTSYSPLVFLAASSSSSSSNTSTITATTTINNNGVVDKKIFDGRRTDNDKTVGSVQRLLLLGSAFKSKLNNKSFKGYDDDGEGDHQQLVHDLKRHGGDDDVDKGDGYDSDRVNKEKLQDLTNHFHDDDDDDYDEEEEEEKDGYDNDSDNNYKNRARPSSGDKGEKLATVANTYTNANTRSRFFKTEDTIRLPSSSEAEADLSLGNHGDESSSSSSSSTSSFRQRIIPKYDSQTGGGGSNWSPQQSPDEGGDDADGKAKAFQPIDHDQGWAFSAYYNHYQPEATRETTGSTPATPTSTMEDQDASQDNPTVRVLVIRLREVKPVTYCHFYDQGGVRTSVKRGRRRSMKDRPGTPYGPFFIECTAPSRKLVSQPYYVSLTSDPDNRKPTNLVKIQYPGPRIRNFTVCFSPFHSNYNFTGQLIESLQFNRLLGADHFIVYNFSVSSQSNAVLRHYETLGLVTVIQWRLPNVDIWYYGQILAVNDCIYRNRGFSKYVIVTDTDEVIVPHQHLTWDSMIPAIEETPSLLEDREDLSEKVLKSIKRHTSGINAQSPFGGFSFRCAFFADKRLEMHEFYNVRKVPFTLEQKKFLVQFPSRAMLSLKRLDNIYDHGLKSKTIVKPECVDVGSVHIVPGFKPGYQMAYVKPGVAMLHHYRDFKILRHYNTLDLSALRFKDTYLEGLKNELLKFPNIFPAVASMFL